MNQMLFLRLQLMSWSTLVNDEAVVEPVVDETRDLRHVFPQARSSGRTQARSPLRQT